MHTANHRPWVVKFADEVRALKFERYLKSGSVSGSPGVTSGRSLLVRDVLVDRRMQSHVVVQEFALSDTLGKPFPEIMREMVLDPIGMTNSTFEQPLPIGRAEREARGTDVLFFRGPIAE